MGSENSNFVRGQLDQAVKEYYIYDGSGRLTDHYTALTNAAHGDFALRTQFQYNGAETSVQKSKESKATWDSSWDVT